MIMCIEYACKLIIHIFALDNNSLTLDLLEG
ncbi:hypothetical protein ALMA_1048 [Alloscardovia macacae]|uniref:Uncharacterized protein n=1 Tax=Alloscardovia macacae TaxID=1160091 RepID=A0A261F3Y7_9BIFI|nr:hypothetical protein ALMA_1048 [Alloscardovia macacae]